MSKFTLKKQLKSLTKEQLVEVVLEAYNNSKAIQEYFDFYLQPNEEEKIRKYKAIIEKEFGLVNPMKAGLKFSVAKKAISEFASLNPSPAALADVMLTLPEAACRFTYEFGDMEEAYYDAAANNFRRVLEYMYKNDLLDKYKSRSINCVEYASVCGYGFADEIADLFFEYYGESASY